MAIITEEKVSFGFFLHVVTRLASELWASLYSPCSAGSRVSQGPQGGFQHAELFVVTHKLGGTQI